MSEKQQLSFVESIERLYPRLPDDMQAQIAPLLQRLKQGDLVAWIDILDLLKDQPDIKVWIRGITKGRTRGFSPLPVPPSPPPVSRCWICPHYVECGEWEPVIQIGEDPPICPKHGVVMRLCSE